MNKLTAEETLKYMIELLTEALMELEAAPKDNDFTYGEKTAYVECLEWIRRWKDAPAHGLNYEIERRFTLL